MFNLVGMSLVSLCFVSWSEAFLIKKHAKQDNNGWAQFGFGNPAPATGNTPASPSATYNQKLPGYYPQPYSPPKFSAPAIPKLNFFPNPSEKFEHSYQTRKYAYPGAYLPAYYMGMNGYSYPQAPRQPFLSKLGLRKFRKGSDYGAYEPGQGQHYGYPSVYSNPIAYANIQPEVKGYGSFPPHVDCSKHMDKYSNVGGRWQEDPPYQYTGHRFGAPLKTASEEKRQP